MTLDARGRALVCVLGVLGGCVMEQGDSVTGGQYALSAAGDLAAPTYDPDPPSTPLPSCWWVVGDQTCATPRCQATAPTTPTRPTTPTGPTVITQTTARQLASVGSITTTGSNPTRSSAIRDITAGEPCPLPNGIPSCPTCERDGAFSSVFQLELQLASRILISNGTSAYVVKDFPSLNAMAANGDGVPRTYVDLAAEGDETMKSATGTVDFNQDLYMFFTNDFETGPYPIGRWMFCPAGGGTCVEVAP